MRSAPLQAIDLDDDLVLKKDAPEINRRVALISLYLRLARRRMQALVGSDLSRLSQRVRERLELALVHLVRTSILTCRLFGAGFGEANRIEDEAAEKERQLEREKQAVKESIIYVGSVKVPRAYTTMGWRTSDGGRVALSRDGGQLILFSGCLGIGKSQSSTNICEGVLEYIEGISSEDHVETAAMSFTYVPDGLRLPDILSGLWPNQSEDEGAFLREHFHAERRPIERMRLVIPEWLIPQYEEELRPYIERGLQVIPLRLRLPQLAMSGIEMLIGGDKNAAYIQVMLEKAEQLGERLTVGDWRQVIEESKELGNLQKRLALSRLRLLEKISGGEHDLWDMVKPGDYTVFVLGGRWIRDHAALPLIMSLMNGLTQPSARWGPFQRVFLLDEVNRYERNAQVMQHLLTTARQIRHRGSMLMLCGQDLLSMDDELVGLATVLGVFRVESPVVWEDIKRRRAGFQGWRFEDVSGLYPGEAIVAVSESTEEKWMRRAQRMKFRPLLCQHGGFTKTVR